MQDKVEHPQSSRKSKKNPCKLLLSMKFSFDIIAPLYDRLIPYREPTEILNDLTTPFQKMIEIGAGTGKFAEFFTHLAQEVWLLDPSPRMLIRAKRRNPQFKIKLGVAEHLPFPNNFFDLVLVSDSLHHWDDHNKGIAEIKRCLKPGGTLVIVEINPKTRPGRFITSMEKTLLMKSTFFTPDQLHSLLTSNGLRTTKARKIRGPTYYLLATKPAP